MNNHEFTFWHLWNSREERLTEELERRRVIRERQEGDMNQKKPTLAGLLDFLRGKAGHAASRQDGGGTE
jgi:hypothetical protein